MAGKFLQKKFADIDLEDAFFDSLKADYPGTENSTAFVDWFKRKAEAGDTALVFEDERGVSAFIAWKDNEEEYLKLQDTVLPAKKRMKISTIKITDRRQGQRIGEGAIGLVLWKWRKSTSDEIYVTVFDKHSVLISLLEKFGFVLYGENANSELVYIKNKKHIDFSDPYKAFPFIKSGFDYAKYVIIEDTYHDTMFAYSELANNKPKWHKDISNIVANGLTKIYVGRAYAVNHKIGEPVLIYRKCTQEGSGKRHRSCITSFCIVTDSFQAKSNNRELMTFDELKARIGNKSVFDEAELYRQYQTFTNVTVVELLYCGYFGAGNNVNMNWLENNGCWTTGPKQYPTKIQLSEEQFKKILTKGKINVSDVIID